MKTLAQKMSLLVALCVALSSCDYSSGNNNANDKAQYVIAFSWQSAFCETAKKKRECKSQTAQRYDATHFSLHGLWPQPGSNIYCGVSEREIAKDKKRQWRALNTQRIDETIWRDLKRVMPGTQSSLHKHEWVKHGTCYDGADINAYFADSLKLMNWINASSLRWRFEAAIGKQLTGKDIREAFDRDFGRGAGKRIRISCKRDQDSGRNMIVELTLGLAGDIASAKTLADLVMAAPETDPGCPNGIIDPVGFQS